MNQIIFNQRKNVKIKYIFKFQFVISILVAIVLIIYSLIIHNQNQNLEDLSKIVNENFKLNSLYSAEKISVEVETEDQNYMGKIIIDKINLEYSIFKDIDDQKLKILPCKFSGVNLGEKGNICIAGHNYNDDRFFSRLDELEIGEKVILMDLNNKVYEYIIFDKYEAKEDDWSILNSSKNYELTLLTCNNSNKKRIIIKAYMKEF